MKASKTKQYQRSRPSRLVACLFAFTVMVVVLLGSGCAKADTGTSDIGSGATGTQQPAASGGEGATSGGFVIEDSATVTVDIKEGSEQ